MHKPMILALAALSSVASFGAIRAITPQVHDASWTKPWWMERHLQKYAAATATDKHRVKNEQVNAIIKDYADGEKVIWVDFNAKFLDEKGDTLWIMPDRLHPNADGYRNIWMPAVLPYFEKIVGPKETAK